MFDIFPGTHKIIANEINHKIGKKHLIKLDEKKMMKGSVLPDFSLKYKFIRHYQEESINYIVSEIMSLVDFFNFFKLSANDKIANNWISLKIGVISHYLSDYVCLPHKERWTFKDSMSSHIKYERRLANIATNHQFNLEDIDVGSFVDLQKESLDLRELIKDYIEKVVLEYSIKRDFERDLNFAFSLNLNILKFVFEVVAIMEKERSLAKSFVY